MSRKSAEKQPRALEPTVSDAVRKYLTASRSPSTVAAYVADLNHFLKHGGQLPATPHVAAEYLAHLAESCSMATVKRRAAAITAAHAELGAASPCHSELVRTLLKGIARTRASLTAKGKRPLLARDVVRAVRGLQGLAGLRDRAMLMLGFAGAFRRSELVAIQVEDISRRRGGIVVRLGRGKTDQEGRGREVAIPRGQGRRCPVMALERWLTAAKIESGPVFRRLTRYGEPTHHPLSGGAVAVAVKRCVARLGLDPRGYGGHSLRAGYVTTAAIKGIPLWQVKRQTGHSRDTTVECYIRAPKQHASRSLL